MPPDMSKYATKAMIGWSIGIISMVVAGGFTLTSKSVNYALVTHSSHPHPGAVDMRMFSAVNEFQNKKLSEKESRILKLENKQEKDHEMIKNVESKLNGIETALEFLVDRAKGLR